MNNKGPEQAVHVHRMILAFVVPIKESRFSCDVGSF